MFLYKVIISKKKTKMTDPDRENRDPRNNQRRGAVADTGGLNDLLQTVFGGLFPDLWRTNRETRRQKRLRRERARRKRERERFRKERSEAASKSLKSVR